MKQKFATGWILFLAALAFLMLAGVTLLSDDAVSERTRIGNPVTDGETPDTADDTPTEANIVASTASDSSESERLLSFASERVLNVHGRPTLVVVYVSSSYALLLLNFVASLLRLQVTNYMVVCTDRPVAEFLAARGLECFLVDNASAKRNLNVASETINKQLPNRNLGKASGNATGKRLARIKRVWVLRATHLTQLLRAGIDVVFSDSDAIWVRNPFKSGLFSSATGDVVAGRGQFPWNVAESWGATLCMGVVFFRSCPAVQALADELAIDVQRTKDDQKSINNILVRWGGTKPTPLFGSRISIHDTHMHSALITKAPGKKGNNNKSIASSSSSQGGPLKLRLVLAANAVVPRFCNIVPKEEWNGLVQIAHCHSNDGKVKRTMRNWGNSDVRITTMQAYKLWCLPDEWSPDASADDKTGGKEQRKQSGDGDVALAKLDEIVPKVSASGEVMTKIDELLLSVSEQTCAAGTGMATLLDLW